MSRLIYFWKRWSGASAIDPDDHLMGALDLSDTAYCADLLARHNAPQAQQPNFNRTPSMPEFRYARAN